MAAGWTLHLLSQNPDDYSSADLYVEQQIAAAVHCFGWLLVIGSARPCTTVNAVWRGPPSRDSGERRSIDVNRKTASQSHLRLCVGETLVPVEDVLLDNLPPALDLGCCCGRRRGIGRDATPPISTHPSSSCACQAHDLVEGSQYDDSADQDLVPVEHRDAEHSPELHARSSSQLASLCWNCPLCCLLRCVSCMGTAVQFTVPVNANHTPETPEQKEERIVLRARLDVHYALLRKQCVSSTMARLTLASSLVVFAVGAYSFIASHFAIEGVISVGMARKFQLAVVVAKVIVGSLPNLARLGNFGFEHCFRFCCSKTYGSNCCASHCQQCGSRRAGEESAVLTEAACPAPAGPAQNQARARWIGDMFMHENPLHGAAAQSASGSGGSRQDRRAPPR